MQWQQVSRSVQELPPATAAEPPALEFTPHRIDPRLKIVEAGRLVGCSYMTIRRRCDAGLLEHEVDATGRIYVRRSDLIRHFGIHGRFRQSAYFWVQESELPTDYERKEHWPKPRRHETITYFPVPLQDMNQNGKT